MKIELDSKEVPFTEKEKRKLMQVLFKLTNRYYRRADRRKGKTYRGRRGWGGGEPPK